MSVRSCICRGSRHRSATASATFRIEQLLKLDDGITLYKVKSETEPFDRIVAECDLAPATVIEVRGPMRTFLIALCLCRRRHDGARRAARPSSSTGSATTSTTRTMPSCRAGRWATALPSSRSTARRSNDWTKLFAYYVFPEAGDDPVMMAQEMGKATKEQNPDANFAVIKNKKDGDAIIDFLTWAPDSDVMEFNVFKYARAEYGPGLVGLQYAQRFKLGDLSVDQFRALRARAVEAMANTDIGQARNFFASKTKEQLGSARGAGETQAHARSTGAGADH